MNQEFYDGDVMGEIFDLYDWVDPNGEKRDPRRFNYSYDPHYLWRLFDKTDMSKEIDVIYSDRMWQWDGEKAKMAFKDAGGPLEHLTPKAAKTIIKRYYDGEVECVGYAICANQSTGYCIGMFYVVPVKTKEKKK